MRVAFAGSPEVAVPVLRALAASRHEVALVVTQPDRPRGRGREPRPTPVGAAATALGLPVIAPGSINAPEALAELRAARVGALCVAAFGQLLRAQVLDGWPCLNVHYSLLPAYRGAAPLERAIMDGRDETGVTIMRMDAGLDTGPTIASERVRIGPDDDFGTLSAVLAERGGALLVAALDDLEAGRLREASQPEEGVSLAPKLTPEERVLDPALPAWALADRVRALRPHIGATLEIAGEPFKVWRARALPEARPRGAAREGDRLLVGCADGTLELVELQPAGRARMDVAAFLRGRRGFLEDGPRPR